MQALTGLRHPINLYQVSLKNMLLLRFIIYLYNNMRIWNNDQISYIHYNMLYIHHNIGFQIAFLLLKYINTYKVI